MPVSAHALRRLSALNLPPEAMSEVLAIFADMQSAEEERLAKQRERKRRSRDSLVTVTGQDCDPSSLSPSPIPTTSIPSPKEKPLRGKKKGDEEPTARHELGTVLDAEHVDAVLEHRRKLRCPLTSHAAKVMAKGFTQFADPNAAADLMISRGWRGFDPEWAQGKLTSSTGPPVAMPGLVKITNTDPRWPIVTARFRAERGKPLNVSEYYAPEEWLNGNGAAA
jgi:hypothetical protein